MSVLRASPARKADAAQRKAKRTAATVRERRRARERQRSQRAPWSVGRVGRPAARRGHQASTAHVQAAYPAVAEAGLGAHGVYIGKDAHGGSFVYDPWVLYGRRILTNANTIVLGSVGYGKSALSKSYQYRQRVFGRIGEFVDPKGEYTQLVAAVGGVTLRLEPGGAVQLNPLDAGWDAGDARGPVGSGHAGDARPPARARPRPSAWSQGWRRRIGTATGRRRRSPT